MQKPIHVISVLSLLALLSLLNACSTASAPQASTANTTPLQEDPYRRIDPGVLQKGMSVETLTDALGTPSKVEPFEREGKRFEIREYRRRFSQFQGTEATGLERIPYIDPVTGEEREQLVPVMQNATANLVQVTELLLHEGVLLEWKQNVVSLGTSFQ